MNLNEQIRSLDARNNFYINASTISRIITVNFDDRSDDDEKIGEVNKYKKLIFSKGTCNFQLALFKFFAEQKKTKKILMKYKFNKFFFHIFKNFYRIF